MNLYATAGFLAAVLPLVATPGASLTLLAQRVTTGGRHEGISVVLGTITGLYVHATLAALGLSALVMRSSQAFVAVKLAGAAYLLILGISIWRSATPRPTARTRLRRSPQSKRSTYTQALLGNVLNPKAASVYLTLTPQFINPDQALVPQILILATAHAALVAVWLLTWTLALDRATRTVTSPRFRKTLSKVSATVLAGLAVRTVAS